MLHVCTAKTSKNTLTYKMSKNTCTYMYTCTTDKTHKHGSQRLSNYACHMKN